MGRLVSPSGAAWPPPSFAPLPAPAVEGRPDEASLAIKEEGQPAMRKLNLIGVALAYGFEAFASGAEAGHGSPSPFAGDVGNVIWTLVIFGALLWVLGKFAWGPILNGLQSRETFIRDSLEQARDQRDEAKTLLAEYEKKLEAARGETEEILAEARRDADAVRLREETRAKEEAEKLLARARREIEIAKDTAVKDLYAQAARLSTAAASKILARELNPADHERLIAESIDAIGELEN
jgi:F-type H+-transporting ATPase subunit b